MWQCEHQLEAVYRAPLTEKEKELIPHIRNMKAIIDLLDKIPDLATLLAQFIDDTNLSTEKLELLAKKLNPPQTEYFKKYINDYHNKSNQTIKQLRIRLNTFSNENARNKILSKYAEYFSKQHDEYFSEQHTF